MKQGTWKTLLVTALLSGAVAPPLYGQALRFSNRREVAIPDYAVIRIGPFYSAATFSQSVGYRWTRSSGTGTDFLIANRRGIIREDGSEFPMVSTLNLRNYLLVTRNMDLDASIRVSYEQYPLGTQDDEFLVDLVEEGVYGTLSMEYRLTPYVRGTLYNNFTYRTDFVDTRGLIDTYGGRRYQYMHNVFGTRLDWLLAPDKNVGLNLSRTDHIPRTSGFEEQEYTAYDGGLLYEYAMLPRVVVGTQAGVTQTDYRIAERQDTRVYQYALFGRYNDRLGVDDEEGVRVRVTDFTTASVGIGYAVGVGVGAGVERGETFARETEPVRVRQASTNVNDSATFTGFMKLQTQLRPRLTHRLGYERKLQGGYKSAFETVDEYEYRLTWAGYATQASAYSVLRVVDPSELDVRAYDDWTSGVNVAYPLTRYATLHGSSTYAIRTQKGTVLDSENLPLEERFDYRTWTTRLGTSFNVTRKVTFDTYAMRIVRTSSADDLGYVRDIVAATLKYTHPF